MNQNLLSHHVILNCRFSRVRSLLKRMYVYLRHCLPIGIIIFTVCTSAFAGIVEKNVPDVIDSSAKYLFYMHGFAIEQGGPRARSYDYSGILKELEKRGFVVIGEERSRVKNDVYAEKVSGQVRKLLAAGVPAKNITVAGHSKGGMITMLVMSMLANPEIAYVNFAGCGKEGSGFGGTLQFAKNRASMAREQRGQVCFWLLC
jgi:hypothetical protein